MIVYDSKLTEVITNGSNHSIFVSKFSNVHVSKVKNILVSSPMKRFWSVKSTEGKGHLALILCTAT